MWLLSRSFSKLVRVPVHLSWVRIFALYLHMHGEAAREWKKPIWCWYDLGRMNLILIGSLKARIISEGLWRSYAGFEPRISLVTNEPLHILKGPVKFVLPPIHTPVIIHTTISSSFTNTKFMFFYREIVWFPTAGNFTITVILVWFSFNFCNIK